MPNADRITVTQQPDPQPANVVKVPRGIIRVNNAVCQGWVDFEVENNALSSADSFTVRFIGSALPPETDVNWFSKQRDMFVEIFAGFPADYDKYMTENLTRIIFGQADTIDYDIAQDIVTVRGRDLTRVFIDAKTTEKFQNQTSSQIATTLAKRRGLTASVTATKTIVGAYYDIEHVNLMDERTEWDILSFLAQQEGFIVYVRDQTLYFGPPPTTQKTDTSALEAQLAQVTAEINADNLQINSMTQQASALKASGNQAGADAITNDQTNLASRVAFVLVPNQLELKKKIAAAQASGAYPIKWTKTAPSTAQWRSMAGNVEDMQFQRTLTVSRGVTVVVRSWNDKQQYGFNATYPPKKVGSLQPGQATVANGGQVFTFFYPNIDKQRALQIAQQKYDLIVQHEMKFSCRIPGDVTLDAQTIIQVSGTDTAFDQTYYPSQIVRRMSFDGGFEMIVHGKNHAATSQAVPL